MKELGIVGKGHDSPKSSFAAMQQKWRAQWQQAYSADYAGALPSTVTGLQQIAALWVNIPQSNGLGVLLQCCAAGVGCLVGARVHSADYAGAHSTVPRLLQPLQIPLPPDSLESCFTAVQREWDAR